MYSESSGSSPRVWGEGQIALHQEQTARIIPTRVGRSKLQSGSITTSTDHPHACGEKGVGLRQQRWPGGSSPRVWGEDGKERSCDQSGRIIPTRVGRRSPAAEGDPANADHPHACGEKDTAIHDEVTYVGSSPRVWGEEGSWRPGRWRRRIIPTRVGRSSSATCSSNLRPDHPHACGEKELEALYREAVRGSSPRVWGEV